MARRTTTTYTSNYQAVKLCAFWGLVLSGIAEFVRLIIKILDKIFEWDDWHWSNKVCSIMSFISTLALFVAAWLAAWDYVKGKSKAWRVVFIIFFVIALLGLFGYHILSWIK